MKNQKAPRQGLKWRVVSYGKQVSSLKATNHEARIMRRYWAQRLSMKRTEFAVEPVRA